MRSHFKYAIFLILVAISITSLPLYTFAQQAKCNITGCIIDEQKLPVSYASVAIYGNGTPLAGTITDNDGKFSLKIGQSDKPHQIVIEFIGYTKVSQTLTPCKSKLELGNITLKEEAISLEGIVVSAKETIKKSTVERTTINASSNMTSSKGTAVDIIRSAPSVTISNEQISVRGNSNILVLLDGVPTTANDLSTIPASNIKSIEVITNPDASYDASGTGGIINIISKKSSAEGLSGIVALNYGFNHFITGNAAIAYNSPKATYRFSYNTKYEDDIINTSLQRKIKTTSENILQQIKATKYTFNNNITFGADFRINPQNKLSIDAKLILPRINIEQKLHNTLTENGVSKEEFRFNDVTWNRENIEGSITYTHNIKPEISEISVKGSVSKIWGHRPSYYYVEDNMTNKSNSGGSPFITSLQIDYKHKLKRGSVSAGAKITYRRNDIYHQFYELKNEIWEYSQELSNDLLHNELVPAAYLMFSSRIGKKFNYKIGLRGELSKVTLDSKHSIVDITNNSGFLAPSLSGSYKFSEGEEISLALSRRIGRPTYPQLNPYMSMVDANTYEQGNMHLQAEKSTKADLSYNLSKGSFNLFVNGYINHTTDYISQITMIESSRLITTYVNAESDIKSGIELSIKGNIAKWMNVSLAANTFYVNTSGKFNGAEISNKGLTNNSNIMADFTTWKGGDIQCQYFVTTPQYFPQLTTELSHHMNIGFKQRLMKGSMNFSLLLTDIFNTSKWEVSSHNNIFDLTNISRNKSRMLWIGLSYNFNSFKQKSGQKTDNDRSLIKLGL